MDWAMVSHLLIYGPGDVTCLWGTEFVQVYDVIIGYMVARWLSTSIVPDTAPDVALIFCLSLDMELIQHITIGNKLFQNILLEDLRMTWTKILPAFQNFTTSTIHVTYDYFPH